ncbi:hypothetical protein KC711_06075 [Candidatus Peregrinibacteria bacterium]|nr:hypothetical protein [Candidatus Peregrinibacteria bacterium]
MTVIVTLLDVTVVLLNPVQVIWYSVVIVGVTVILSLAHFDIAPGLSIHHPVTLLVVHEICVLLPAEIDVEFAANELIVGFCRTVTVTLFSSQNKPAAPVHRSV